MRYEREAAMLNHARGTGPADVRNILMQLDTARQATGSPSIFQEQQQQKPRILTPDSTIAVPR